MKLGPQHASQASTPSAIDELDTPLSEEWTAFTEELDKASHSTSGLDLKHALERNDVCSTELLCQGLERMEGHAWQFSVTSSKEMDRLLAADAEKSPMTVDYSQAGKS